MTNPLTRIDKALKTKEDLQGFVLFAFILFILFVKCYLLVVDPKVENEAANQRNADMVKTTSDTNI